MEDIKSKIIPILKEYGIEKAALFGSYASGNHNESSDVDILIQPSKGMGLGFVRLKRDLEQSLNKEVDLLSYNGISPYLKQSILKHQEDLI